jgi:D-alanine-D-alanine ligase and related ATP-grasp enzymes
MIKEYEGLELSTQMMIKEALERNIKVEVLDWDDNFIRLIQGEKVEYIKQATKTSKDTYIAPLIMENKEVTKIVLRENGIRVPDGITIKSIEEGLERIETFWGKDLVVKPKSTNFGQGVVILKGDYSREDVRRAMELAFTYDSSILLEEFISGKEYRFFVVEEEVVAILHRVPANVTGDGFHTIRELVEEKNRDPLRGKGYVTPLEKIVLGQIEKEYLDSQGKTFDTIPLKNETVYLRENSNISTGGDSIDYTDEVIEEYKQIAVQAAKSAGAKICGADIMIRDIHKKPTSNNYGIIEINFNPAIHIHDFPYQGKNRFVEKKILDLLGF